MTHQELDQELELDQERQAQHILTGFVFRIRIAALPELGLATTQIIAAYPNPLAEIAAFVIEAILNG